jgi:hypothetical protein
MSVFFEGKGERLEFHDIPNGVFFEEGGEGVILPEVLIFAENLVGEVCGFDDVFVGFDVDGIGEEEDFSKEIITSGDETIVLFFVEREGVFDGVLVDNFVLFFHESLDVDFVFSEDVFESEEGFFACVEGDFVLFKLGVGGEKLELVESKGFLNFVGGCFFVGVFIDLGGGDGALEGCDLVIEVEDKA